MFEDLSACPILAHDHPKSFVDRIKRILRYRKRPHLLR